MNTQLLLLVLGLVAAVVADDVQDLTDGDFESRIGGYDTVLVMFYAPWCGHCKKLKPEFERASTLLKNNDPPVILAKVDCTEGGKDTCGKFKVSGYPTLKIFKGGELSSDYNGPREANGIVKYMRSQVGPASKEITTGEMLNEFIAKPEVSVIYFGMESAMKDAFMKTAEKLRETVRFAHSIKEYDEKTDTKNMVILFRPNHLENKFEPSYVPYQGEPEKGAIETFIKTNYHGLVGHRIAESGFEITPPMVIAYYNVDYTKNPKGTNYWRNRIIKISKNFEDLNFGISNKDDFQHELNEFGLDFVTGDKPVICAQDKNMKKYVMKEEFTMENFEAFLTKLSAGEVEPFVKSEAVPTQDGPVVVAVGKNFDEVVTNSKNDVLIEFYAPWCGHCKKLAPTYDELGEAMKDENVDIVKIDATANDYPSSFNVRGFPTIFWKPAGGSPVAYNGGRELNDFVKYIAKEATEELNGWDRKGKVKKVEL